MKGITCNHCGSELVNGRKVENFERKALSAIAPMASDSVMVCAKCYPEKAKVTK